MYGGLNNYGNCYFFYIFFSFFSFYFYSNILKDAYFTDIWRYEISTSSWFWQWGPNTTNSNSDPKPFILSSTAIVGKKLWMYGGFYKGI